jgi:putative phosphoesterase
VRVGIVSDIHCNVRGLEAALELMGDIDELFCAGDSVFQYRWSNDVIALLKEREAYVIQGNHEEILLGPDGARALSAPLVDASLVAWLRDQPFHLETEVDGKRVLMTHSSPWEPHRDYHYPGEAIWAQAADLEVDTLIVGHTHFQMAERFGSTLVINPGSTGEPRDHRNDFLLSSAVWDTATDDVTFFEYEDPMRASDPQAGLLAGGGEGPRTTEQERAATWRS